MQAGTFGREIVAETDPLEVRTQVHPAIPAHVWARACERARQAMESLLAAHARRPMRLLDIPFETEDLPALDDWAGRLVKGARHVVLFGTGGSSLGAQALAQIGYLITGGARADCGSRPDFHFLDNLESPWVERVLRRLDLASTRFLVVSKSGSTPETVAQAIMAIEMMRQAGLEREIPERMLFLSDPERRDGGRRNVLRALAARFGIPVIDHEPEIGGRFSVLTNVGLLPAAMFGLDPAAVRGGARQVLEVLFSRPDVEAFAPATGAALHVALKETLGTGIMVTMPYTSRLRLFGAWLQQLWAESLGKAGHGTQPVTAVGPVDQHSQLQLYLDGPNDKLFNIIQIGRCEESFRVPAEYAEFTDLAGYKVNDLTLAQQRATTETLLRRGRPVRVFLIDSVNEITVGALFMHFMLETMLLARMLGINAFDQPAVEESKTLARAYLRQIHTHPAEA